MKRNKIAAGALALALGLGAVAPAYAETTVTETKTKHTTVDSENGVGEYGVTKEYRYWEDKYVAVFNEIVEARKALEAAKANEATAKAAYEAALAKLAKLEARYGDTAGDYTDSEYQKELDRVESEKLAAILKYENNTLTLAQKPNYDVLTEKYLDNLSKYIDKSVDNPHQEAQAEALKDIIALNARLAVLKDELKGVEDKRADLQAEVSRRLGDWNEAKNKVQLAAKKVEKAEGKYESVRKSFVQAGADRVTIRKAEEAGDVTIVVKETTTETTKPATETTTEKETETTVTDDSKVADDEISAETKAELEKAIADSKVQIEAVKFLKENTPKTIEKVADKLDKLVKEANATIKLSEELLGKKSALNFVSTAYAAEEKSKEERAKELRDKLNANTQEIKDTLKENEASLVEEEENKDDEKETPAPEKEDSKEDDKKEDSKEDDKKEDSKKDDKKEDSKEDDKKEDKKVEKTTKVVKKAGKNAKTGIAGVAGVAGVLAAASVAYAASKKNN